MTGARSSSVSTACTPGSGERARRSTWISGVRVRAAHERGVQHAGSAMSSTKRPCPRSSGRSSRRGMRAPIRSGHVGERVSPPSPWRPWPPRPWAWRRPPPAARRAGGRWTGLTSKLSRRASARNSGSCMVRSNAGDQRGLAVGGNAGRGRERPRHGLADQDQFEDLQLLRRARQLARQRHVRQASRPPS